MRNPIAIAAGMALAGAFLPGSASAEEAGADSGAWYATAAVGMAFPGGATESDTAPGYGKIKGEYELDSGFGFSVGVGRAFSPLRVEGVLSRFDLDVSSVKIKSIETPNPSGFLDRTSSVGFKGDVDAEASTLALMGNVWFDIDTGSGLEPFVGGGLGMAQLDTEIDSMTVGNLVFPVSGGGDDWVFAWQIGAGVGYALSDGVTAQLGYRFFNMGEADIEGAAVEPDGVHIVEIGLRFGL